MRVLGIDPGTRVVGYGVVERQRQTFICLGCGTIRVKPSMTLPERLRHIFDGLMTVIDEFEPSSVSLEDVFHGKNTRSLVRIGEGRGVAMLAAAKADLEVEHYAPSVVKKALTGTGSATKNQVSSTVRGLLGDAVETSSLDATDALALAICHLHRSRISWAAASPGRPAEPQAEQQGGPQSEKTTTRPAKREPAPWWRSGSR